MYILLHIIVVYSIQKEYIALQRKAEEQCDARLIEIGQKFADNERVRIKREDMVLSQTEDIINAAKSFISELNEDIKRINRNNTNHVYKAAEVADKALERMGQKLAIASVDTYAIEVKD